MQFLTKPLLIVLAFVGSFVLVELLLIGFNPNGLMQRMAVAAIVALPYFFMAYFLVLHLDYEHELMTNEAMTDPLTALPNRRAFVARAEAAIAKDFRGFLLLLDADRFKRINDTYGHDAGDECLRQIAVRIREVCGPMDHFGRIGGEEFAILFPERTQAELETLGRKLCSPHLILIPTQDEPIRLTQSIGATEVNPQEIFAHALKRADEALYAAKENGRARMHVWRKSYAIRAA